MKKLIIFGAGKIAEVAYNCFLETGDYQIVGFACDKEFITAQTYLGLPVKPFETIETHWNVTEHECFVALGYQNINELRATKVSAVRDKGYRLASYISPCLELSNSIKIGEHCFVMQGVHLQPCTKIGDNVFLWSGSIVGHHSNIGNNCWVTSGANIAGSVKIDSNSFLAINSTIANDVSLGKRCFIGANALVTKSLEDDSVVIEASTKKFQLKTKDFLKMTLFS